jgi:hypothetical protein
VGTNYSMESIVVVLGRRIAEAKVTAWRVDRHRKKL